MKKLEFVYKLRIMKRHVLQFDMPKKYIAHVFSDRLAKF